MVDIIHLELHYKGSIPCSPLNCKEYNLIKYCSIRSCDCTVQFDRYTCIESYCKKRKKGKELPYHVVTSTAGILSLSLAQVRFRQGVSQITFDASCSSELSNPLTTLFVCLSAR